MRRVVRCRQHSVSSAWSAGWVLPLALLALPGCGNLFGFVHLSDPGPSPTSVIFCDIQQPTGSGCATADDIGLGIRLEEAATALVAGESKPFGLDYSQAALDACGGLPRKIAFQGPFPEGFPACVDCAGIGSTYADAIAFCIDKCSDLAEGDAAFCEQPGVVKLATSFAPQGSACYANACFAEGTPRTDFDDPRRHPEPVDWQDLVNITDAGVSVTDSGATLTRDTTDQKMFDAGADAPSQLITHGNAYVEFTAGGPTPDKVTTTARLCGLSEGPGDANPTPSNISFALDLFANGCLYVFEKGVQAKGPIQTCTVPDAVGAYAQGEVFRVRVTDNLDGTGPYAPMGGHATVTYTRLMGSCLDGHVCSEEPLWTSQSVAQYPLRVDSSFREQDGQLTNVRIVRIRQ
jgi:hypothetical protein